MTIRIPSRALVVLAGPSGSGKSTWAGRWFRPNQVVASDDLRAVVGEHEADLRAGGDAFDVLDLIVERRLKRGLLTVVDTLGMDTDRLERWLALAEQAKRPAHLILWDTDDKTCRSRNRARAQPVPSKVLTAQLAKWADVRDQLGDGFDAVHTVDDVAVVPELFARAGESAASQADDPVALRFGLQVSAFDWGDNADIAARLGDIAAEAEEAGFSSLWVMDHFIQIPQVGREWEPMLESHTTLGYLAARTSTLRLGTLVTGITYRNVAHLAKIVATLDVLSEGRAACGIGAAWFEREHIAYCYAFPGLDERYELLEDALELLPLMWGSGTPSYDGRRISTPEAICYPRPLQERIPILVGGSGEARTLRLVARHADACNLFGDPATVRRKVEILHAHCDAEDRDPEAVTVTHLSTALTAPTRAELDVKVERLGAGRASPEDVARATNAGSTEDQIGRYRDLADAGVQEAVVSLADVGEPGSVLDFAPVIETFAR
ncbi:MAG: TIGR03560 family F420-dependent LLM class oxidoreductase [Actinomycetota bacterium]